MNIKPIETVYNGYRFRSRLEARWAVFFDSSKIKYLYEPEGFKLSDGTYYLPDFYLPDEDYYVEVKGNNDHLETDLKKVDQFVVDSKKSVIILSELPFDESSNGLYWFPSASYTSKKCCGHIVHDYVFFGECPEPEREHAFIVDHYALGCEKHWYFTRTYESIQPISGAEWDTRQQYERDLDVSKVRLEEMNEFNDVWNVKNDFSGAVQNAIISARQARFEHGENGAPTWR